MEAQRMTWPWFDDLSYHQPILSEVRKPRRSSSGCRPQTAQSTDCVGTAMASGSARATARLDSSQRQGDLDNRLTLREALYRPYEPYMAWNGLR